MSRILEQSLLWISLDPMDGKTDSINEIMKKYTVPQAFMASPGPNSPSEAVALFLKGVCMGAADIIPGVSGGTIAFITGIYDQLVDAIRSFDTTFIRRFFSGNITQALANLHFRFLLCLLAGIGVALVGMAGIVHHLLITYPVHVWSVFFGLIAASVVVVGRRVGGFNVVNAVWCILGALFSYTLVGMIPVSTPETTWFIFLCGMIAICAMILPGISGAFILLMLGKYAYVTATLRNPFAPGSLATIGVFAAGALCGIVVFSRILHYLLSRWHAATVSVLTGFMIGALRKVWPWKEVLETTVIRGKVHVLREMNVFPPAIDGAFWLAVVLAVGGGVVVILLERCSHRSCPAGSDLNGTRKR